MSAPQDTVRQFTVGADDAVFKFVLETDVRLSSKEILIILLTKVDFAH